MEQPIGRADGLWRHLSQIIVLTLFAMALMVVPPGSPSAEASTDDHWIEVIYMVPSDSSYRAEAQQRATNLVRAATLVHEQWASWGFTFQLVKTPRIVHINHPKSYFQGTATRKRMEAEIQLQPNVKYLIFMDEATHPLGAAHGGGNVASFYSHITNDIMNELAAGVRQGSNDIGSIRSRTRTHIRNAS